jgi:hypothetical protein
MNPDEFPTDRNEAIKFNPDIERLEPDSAASCPYSLGKIRTYLRAETGADVADLFFGRTALIGEVKFWLWGYVKDSHSYFVDVSSGGGKTRVGMGSGEGLTPEQYIALEYARHWGKKRGRLFG